MGNVTSMGQQAEEEGVAIGERLDWICRYLGMSQKEFAKSIGVLPTTFSNWRRGTQTLSLHGALRIKKKHQVSLDFLYSGDSNNLPERMRAAWEARAKN